MLIGHHRSLCVKLFPSTDQSLNADACIQNGNAITESHNINQVAEVEEMMLSSGKAQPSPKTSSKQH